MIFTFEPRRHAASTRPASYNTQKVDNRSRHRRRRFYWPISRPRQVPEFLARAIARRRSVLMQLHATNTLDDKLHSLMYAFTICHRHKSAGAYFTPHHDSTLPQGRRDKQTRIAGLYMMPADDFKYVRQNAMKHRRAMAIMPPPTVLVISS